MPNVRRPESKVKQNERYRDRQARKRHAAAREARRPNLDADPAVVLYRAEKAKRASPCRFTFLQLPIDAET